MSNRNLSTYAMLRMLQQRKGKNYLDNFSGFIEEILLRSTEPLTTEHIVQKMDHNFSISIPNGTVKILVKRGEKSQRILCISQHEPKKYTLNNAVINSDTTRDFESTRNEVNRKIDDVIKKFINYCHNYHKVFLSNDQAEEIILKFLKTHDNFPIAGNDFSSNLQSSDTFLFGSFITHIEELDSIALENLSLISAGMTISNALLFSPEPQDITRKFTRTTVYFDAGILATFLTTPDTTQQEHTELFEIVKLLRATSGTPACFEHTADETANILLSLTRSLERGNINEDSSFVYKSSFKRLIDANMGSADVLVMASDISNHLSRAGVLVTKNPAYKEHKRVVDEKNLEKQLIKSLGYPLRDNKNDSSAARKDALSIAAMARLVGRDRPDLLERLNHIFVSTNKKLMLFAHDFLLKDGFTGGAPIFLDVNFLCSYLWLKSPGSIPDLPERQLIANALAAVQPSEKFLSVFYQKLQNMKKHEIVTDEDILLLKSSDYAQKEIMNVTRGDSDNLNDEKMMIALENIKNKMTKEKDAQIEKLNVQVNQLRNKIDTHQIDSEKLQIDTIDQSKLRIETAKLEGIQQEREKIANFISKILSWIVMMILAGIPLSIILFLFQLFFDGNYAWIPAFVAAVLIPIIINFFKPNVIQNLADRISAQFLKRWH